MPISDDGFTQYTEDEIFNRLISNFESEFETTVQPGQLVRKQIRAEARVRAAYQEPALEEVYESAYLTSATDNELDKLVERIGLSRQEAVPATGTVDFISDDIPTNDYTIPSGTTVQTGGSDPIAFETTATTQLSHIDGFSDGDLTEYAGDTTSFSVVSHNGGQAVELPASSGVSIYRTTPDVRIGATINTDWDLKTGVTKSFRLRKDDSNYYEITLDVGASDLTVAVIDGGSTTKSDTTNATFPTADPCHVEVAWDVTGKLTTILYETDDRNNEIARSSVETDDNYYTMNVGISSQDATATSHLSNISTTRTTANIEGQDGGVGTNVAPRTIRVMPSPPTGVNRITNPLATGDNSLENTVGTSFVLGKNRESDEQLRNRAEESSSIGGSATVDSIGSAIRNLESVNSLKVFQNKTDTDNTGTGGLPPHSFEVAVHGGIDEAIANTIFDVKCIDSRDYGGAHGTEKSYTVSSDILNEDETINWTDVPEITLNITVDLIVDGTYVGDEEVQSLIVDYVGGTDVNGAIVAGTSVGEDVYVSVVEDQVVDPNATGVWEVDAITIDRDGDGTDDTTTLANGADVLQIASSEIAVANGRDGSITINVADK